MSVPQEHWKKLPKDMKGELRWKNGWAWLDVYMELSANTIILSPKYNKGQRLKTISFTQIAEIAEIKKTLNDCFKISLKNGRAEQFQCTQKGAQATKMWINNLRHAKKFWEDKESIEQTRRPRERKITLEKENEASKSLDPNKPRVFFTLWNGEMVGLLVENTSTFTDVYPRLFSSVNHRGTCCMCELRHMTSGLWAVDTSGKKRLVSKDEILIDLSRRGDLLFVLEHHQKLLIVHFNDSSYEILPAPSAITAGEILKLNAIAAKLDYLRCLNPGLFLLVESGEELLFQDSERPFKYPHGKFVARSKSIRVNSKKKTKEEIIAGLRRDAYIHFYRRQKMNAVLKKTLADQIQKSTNLSDGLFFKEDHFALEDDVMRGEAAEPKDKLSHPRRTHLPGPRKTLACPESQPVTSANQGFDTGGCAQSRRVISAPQSSNFGEEADKVASISAIPFATADPKRDSGCNSNNDSRKPDHLVSEFQGPLTGVTTKSNIVCELPQTCNDAKVWTSPRQSSESLRGGIKVLSVGADEFAEQGDDTRVVNHPHQSVSKYKHAGSETVCDQVVGFSCRNNDPRTSKSLLQSESPFQGSFEVADTENKKGSDKVSEGLPNSSNEENKANELGTPAPLSETSDHIYQNFGEHACFPENKRSTAVIDPTVPVNVESEASNLENLNQAEISSINDTYDNSDVRKPQGEAADDDYKQNCHENFDSGRFKAENMVRGRSPQRSLSEPFPFLAENVKKCNEKFRSVSDPNLHLTFFSDALENSMATSEPDLNENNQCIKVHEVYDPKESSCDSDDDVFLASKCPSACLQSHTNSLGPEWKVAKNVENAVKRVLNVKDNSREVDECIAKELSPSLMVILENGLKKSPSFWSLIGKGNNVWNICKIVCATTHVGEDITPWIERVCLGSDITVKFRYFVRACIQESYLSKWFELLHRENVLRKISENYEKKALLLEMANSAAMEHLKLYLDKLNDLKLQDENSLKKSREEDFLISVE